MATGSTEPETFYITNGSIIVKCVRDAITKEPIETRQFGKDNTTFIGICVILAIIPITAILWQVVDYIAR